MALVLLRDGDRIAEGQLGQVANRESADTARAGTLILGRISLVGIIFWV